jgi:hypothetical protein
VLDLLLLAALLVDAMVLPGLLGISVRPHGL